ncbi:efflux transporter outer membrane subunit [Novosphingobium sediminicola]|uniref:NodT family efflux transporter outer membrane factor (OMF) lipoprotein n=1 Tax=Novosphingobium sediminicola TaxID=563162 RepID=A0A7W6G7Q5_9SPHN|nr:efflux transporter outer membrane subunit [Novosphingobium sediminicola]MBB3956623.1 NodT family efflux transporter outer membrane factor (OMF) lipoprotein [Novosphingobium sediminicola]
MRLITLSALALSASTPALAQEPWWQAFHDPLLNAAEERALDSNLTLEVAAARVEQARALARRAGAALLPAVSLSASAEETRQSLHSPLGSASRTIGLPRDYQLYQAGVGAQWEIDLFGGLSAGRRAAASGAAATLADEQAARLSVTSDVADAYLHLRALQQRLALAQEQADLRGQLAVLVNQRTGQGLASRFDANRAQAAHAAALAAMPALRQAIAVDLDRLGVLTGDRTWPERLRSPAPLPSGFTPSPEADPAALMRRRPDLAAAEARAAGAEARIAMVKADYYPHLSLSGLVGLATVGGFSLASSDSVMAGGGAALRWRLFDFGRLDAEMAAARGGRREALAQWRQAALMAGAEVGDAMAALDEGAHAVAALGREVDLLTRARDQARDAYAQGAVSLIDVLDADRNLLDASDRLTQARETLARASVAAVRAMGGGFETAQETTHHG